MDCELCDVRRAKAERAEQRRRDEADKLWRQLLRAVWTRVRLGSAYGAAGVDPTTTEGMLQALLRGRVPTRYQLEVMAAWPWLEHNLFLGIVDVDGIGAHATGCYFCQSHKGSCWFAQLAGAYLLVSITCRLSGSSGQEACSREGHLGHRSQVSSA